jgi:hypothetical protein
MVSVSKVVTAFEKLESRRMFSLLGLSPGLPRIGGADVDVPPVDQGIAYSVSGSVGSFDLTATPTRILFDSSNLPTNWAGPNLRLISDPKLFTVGMKLDAAGNIISGIAGAPDLSITGWIDVNNNGVLDPGIDIDGTSTSSPLLTGEVMQFGFLDSASSPDQYDFRFAPTGGQLYNPYFINKDIYLLISSGQSSFSGDFSQPFTGSSLATLGPVGQLRSSLSGFVYEDFNNDGQVDLGEPAISGTTVKLTGTDVSGNPVSYTTTTDSSGFHSFTGLLPGKYTLMETQPATYADGKDTIDPVDGLGGTLSNDLFSTIPVGAGQMGLNYNYGERPLAGGAVKSGQTATIGYWNNKNGQALLRSLNGGPNATNLGDWLADSFPHMYGALSGGNSLAGKTNDYIANFYQATKFSVKGQKLDAQVMGVAFAVYVTNTNLNTGSGASMAMGQGFTLSSDGLGASTMNVGSNGAAFGVANNTTMRVIDMLLATDSMTVNGVLYNGNTSLRDMANTVYTKINEQGDI